jgi:hypothetical protein
MRSTNTDAEFFRGHRIPIHRGRQQAKSRQPRVGDHREHLEDGRPRLKMDGGCAVELDTHKHPHPDHGYAMNSHSSQGQTAYWQVQFVVKAVPQLLRCTNQLNMGRRVMPSERSI